MRASALPFTLCLFVAACGEGGGLTDPGTGGPATDADTMAGTSTDPGATEPTTGEPGDPTGDPGGPTTDPPPPNCGDGMLDPDEQCDAGAANSDQGACTKSCKEANCGDGLVHAGEEECDDGNVDYSDDCAASCKSARCGDKHLGPGEGCDDGNDIDDDDCSNACIPSTCGDTQLQVGEQCDDGNDDQTDECLNSCQAAKCGDKVVQAGVEQCDDGNAIEDDGCTSMCTTGGGMPGCADGMKNGDESDVDCGGSCNACADGEACVDGDDCQSASCEGGICGPGGGPTLMPVDCPPAMVGVDAAFAGAIMGNCGCHGGGQGGITFTDAASFKTATVNVKSAKSSMNRVTPGNINESYLLYKLHGQQAAAPGGAGSQMPLGGNQLSDDKLCLVINWVKSIK